MKKKIDNTLTKLLNKKSNVATTGDKCLSCGMCDNSPKIEDYLNISIDSNHRFRESSQG